MKYLLWKKKYKEVYKELSSRITDNLGIKKPIPPPCHLISSIYGLEIGLSSRIPDIDIEIEVSKSGIFRRNTLVEILGSNEGTINAVASIIEKYAGYDGYEVKKF